MKTQNIRKPRNVQINNRPFCITGTLIKIGAGTHPAPQKQKSPPPSMLGGGN